MDFESSFCPSPWFHLRINAGGNYEYCRWANKDNRYQDDNINTVSPITFFQKGLSPIRNKMLLGIPVSGCSECHAMENNNKVSGRQKQMIKAGILPDHFAPSLKSSPWYSTFNHSVEFNGDTNQTPQDWQIDLGNFCNSACLFCDQYSSSRLAAEWKRVGIITQVPKLSWAEQPELVDKFLLDLDQCKHVRYVHFIGGEPLIMPSFKRILEKLVNLNLHQEITIGFTTNLTVWDQAVVDLLIKFKSVNLGMSIESLDSVNDYVRWPSVVSDVKETLNKWVNIANANSWLTQIRITPTILTVHKLLDLYEFGFKNNICIESCNFIHKPEFMRPSVLPIKYRKPIIEKFKSWVNTHQQDLTKVYNIRNPSVAKQQIVQDLTSYINYLEQQPDESYRLSDLIAYLHIMEQSRSNSILNYLPEYEEFFRSAGY